MANEEKPQKKVHVHICKNYMTLKSIEKIHLCEKVADAIVDDDRALLLKIEEEPEPEKHDKKILDQLKKRQLINHVSKKSYKFTKGENYLPKR